MQVEQPSITLYHNPACGTSRNTLALIRNSGIEPEIVEYLKTPPGKDRLRSLVQAMGMPVRELLRQKGTPYEELGLAVVAIHDLGNRVAVLHKALPNRLDVARSPVEPDALVRLRLDRTTLSLIEPERQALIMDHASDEAPLVPHRPIHGQPKPIDPEAQTFFQVRAGYDRNARLKMHVCLRVSLISARRPLF